MLLSGVETKKAFRVRLGNSTVALPDRRTDDDISNY